MEKKYKSWCFTSFDIENEPKFDEKIMEYLGDNREICPETGRVHFQRFVCFKARKRFTYVQKVVPGLHIERAEGSIDENIAYSSKDEKYNELYNNESIMNV